MRRLKGQDSGLALDRASDRAEVAARTFAEAHKEAVSRFRDYFSQAERRRFSAELDMALEAIRRNGGDAQAFGPVLPPSQDASNTLKHIEDATVRKIDDMRALRISTMDGLGRISADVSPDIARDAQRIVSEALAILLNRAAIAMEINARSMDGARNGPDASGIAASEGDTTAMKLAQMVYLSRFVGDGRKPNPQVAIDIMQSGSGEGLLMHLGLKNQRRA